MDLSKVKMVVTDMDGTLLNSNHEVSNRFFELFKELQKRDILFVAASGRQYNSMVDKLAAIQDQIIVVAENGAFIKHKNKELLTTPLEKKRINTILNIVKNGDGMHAALCCKHKAYVSGESESFINMLRQYYANFEVIDLNEAIDDEILKIAIYHFESSEDFIYPAVRHLEGELKVKVSGPNWVDVSSINAHKGYAISKLMKDYNISENELMVFGDFNNDLEMLALADFSFAMENAHPNVLKIANYKTASNDHFGVERILEQLISSQSVKKNGY